MTSQEEKNFMIFWEENRMKEKQLTRKILPGFVTGLAMGVAILLLLGSGWYTRANMVASFRLNPYIMLIAIISISTFIGIFYKNFKWEMNEQKYLEIKAKEKRKTDVDAAK